MSTIVRLGKLAIDVYFHEYFNKTKMRPYEHMAYVFNSCSLLLELDTSHASQSSGLYPWIPSVPYKYETETHQIYTAIQAAIEI